MMTNISKVALSLTLAAFITACGEKPKPEAQDQVSADFQCKQENILAPTWTCIPDVPGYYAGVGVAEKSAAGIAHMRRVALMNGRSDLAQQIQTQVKDKVEGFTRATGNGSAETVDKVTTAVTKQVAKVDLKSSKMVNMWQAPSGAIYMLVTVPQSEVNKEVKDAVKTSFKNDEALWQQFQAKQALEQLDKEFPTE
ncbi:LPP20 family lipoprotein [Sulfurimonas sp. C5]|uniref:LPP20 family lipoprotein n=1 Tax=Sulfurimonas sp. C5 TaxID=3036947 RepID=UPI0024559DAB|nr:LPP20 family lipoprotein [Sulfurimonas sp. C5]MDH4945415.1 LPP20 family lipoprotein [Sulfurimonas sp. C5]